MLLHKLREFEGIYTGEIQIHAGFCILESSIRLEYRLTGNLEQLLIPDKVIAPQFRDELWKHTCFEAFLLDQDETRYWEFNFSPSRDWAIYRFADYRQRDLGERLDDIDLVIQQERYPSEFVLKVEIKPYERFAIKRVGLTSVLEHQTAKTSYWALHHAREKPDFHAKESFILSL